MANRNFASAGKIYSARTRPVLIDCNFIVDSTNVNGLGIRDLKGPLVAHVFMQSQSAAPSPPPGSPVLGTSSTYAVLAASTITNTGSSVLTGDLGLYAGTSVTGFPPGTVSGIQHIADAAANQAQIDATVAYTDLFSRSATSISSTLDGQTLSAGVYTETSGTFNLAQSGNGTLTLNGSATDIFVFRCSSTLVTGAGGTPTIAFTGGALASNVYWVLGSSATLNVSGTGAFQGTVIAQASVTILGGSAAGRLMARTGAVTISAATNITVPSASLPVHTPGTPQPGVIVVQLQDNYNRLTGEFHSLSAPTSTTEVKIDNSAMTAGVAYVITTLGNATAAKWHTIGVPAGVTPAVGVSFVALSDGGAGNVLTSRVATSALAGSTTATIETVGNSDLALAPDPRSNQGFGSQIILQARDFAATVAAPADGTLISLSFLIDDSSVRVNGQ